MNVDIDYFAIPIGSGKYHVHKESSNGRLELCYDGNPVVFHCINIASLTADMMADGGEEATMLHGEYWRTV